MNESEELYGLYQGCPVHGEEFMRECSVCGGEYCAQCYPGGGGLCSSCASDEPEEETEDPDFSDVDDLDTLIGDDEEAEDIIREGEELFPEKE